MRSQMPPGHRSLHAHLVILAGSSWEATAKGHRCFQDKALPTHAYSSMSHSDEKEELLRMHAGTQKVPWPRGRVYFPTGPGRVSHAVESSARMCRITVLHGSFPK